MEKVKVKMAYLISGEAVGCRMWIEGFFKYKT
jgi:hypothetical protein